MQEEEIRGGVRFSIMARFHQIRFYIICHIRFGKRDYEDSDPADLMYEDMYFEKRAPMRFGKRSDDYFY